MIGFGVLVSTILLGADGYALIVSNNRSLDLARPDLRYATLTMMVLSGPSYSLRFWGQTRLSC